MLNSRTAVSWYFLCCGLIFSSWAARIPSIKDHFKLNEAELGIVLFMLPLGSFIALPFAGWSVHRFGSRIITVIAILSYATLLVGISLGRTVYHLSVFLFLFGFAGDLLNIAMNTQGLSVQQNLRKPILSRLHAMWSVGALLGALIGGWTLQLHLTTFSHFLLVAVTVTVFSILFYFLMIADAAAAPGSRKLFAIPDKALLLLGLICFCTAICEGAMADWSSLYYRQTLKNPEGLSTTGYTAFTFSMALGRFMGDRLIRNFGHRSMLMMNGLLILAGLLIAIFLQLPLVVIAGYSLVGLGVSSVIPIVYMLAAGSRTMVPSAALAAVSTIGFTGFLSGPPLIGLIAHETGLRWALLMVALLGGIIFLLSFRGISRNKAES